MSDHRAATTASKQDERVAAAHARRRARPLRPTYPAATALEDDPTGAILKERVQNSTALIADALASRSPDFIGQSVHDLTMVMQTQQPDDPAGFGLNAGLAAVAAVGARDEIEAQLALQMAGTHRLAMQALGRASRSTDAQVADSYGTLATKMLRTYTTQLEALAKLRRGGQQTVRVEHVHVYEGGQAIVGHVETGGRRAQHENGRQPHAPGISVEKPTLTTAVGGAMLRDHTERKGVLITSGEREAPMPNARRGRRQRSTQRVGERQFPPRPENG